MQLHEISALINSAFATEAYQIIHASSTQAIVYYPTQPTDVRPGDTIAGPVMMGLADLAIYVWVLATTSEIQAVTSQLHFDFLRRPQANIPLYAIVQPLKQGKRLCVANVLIYSGYIRQDASSTFLPQKDHCLVMHATGTYALPEQR